MPKYRVQILRTGYRTAEIEVEAESLEQAEKIALEDPGARLFSGEFDADYSAGNVEMIEEEV